MTRTPEQERLNNRILALEFTVQQLLTMLFEDGTLLEEELVELQERLGA